MNRYRVVSNGYRYPLEILADDFMIEPDTGNAVFFKNDCNVTKIACFREYSNIYLIQEDEKNVEIIKLEKEVKLLNLKFNKTIKWYKYALLISTLLIIYALWK